MAKKRLMGRLWRAKSCVMYNRLRCGRGSCLGYRETRGFHSDQRRGTQLEEAASISHHPSSLFAQQAWPRKKTRVGGRDTAQQINIDFFAHTLSLSRAVMIIRHSTVKCVMYQTVALSYYTFVLKAGLTQTLTAMQTHRRGGFSLLSGEFANIWQSSY